MTTARFAMFLFLAGCGGSESARDAATAVGAQLHDMAITSDATTDDLLSDLPIGCSTSNVSCPLVYRAPRQLGSGDDAANVVGQRLGTDVTVWVQAISTGVREQLKIITTNEALLQVSAPQTITTPSLLALWVERVTGGVTYDSAPVFVNAPSIDMVSETTVRPGGTLYVWGRQLGTAVVFHGDDDVPAIATGDDMQLAITVPALMSGKTYELVIDNALGGTTTYSQAIIAGPAGGDVYQLGVYWGADFDFVSTANTYDVTTSTALTQHAVGNGTTDDTVALQAALDYVGKAGGGVVYAPAGTYKVTAELAFRYSKTILAGAGTSTVFTYGAGSSTASTEVGFAVIPQGNVADIGMSKIKVVNQWTADNGTANGAIRAYSGVTDVTKVFLADMTFDVGNGEAISFGSVTSDVVITRSTISSERTVGLPSGFVSGALSIHVPNLTLTHNTVTYNMARVALSGANHKVIMDNTFTVNGSVANLDSLGATKLETGGVEISFSDEVALVGNTIQVQPAPDFSTLPAADVQFIAGCFELVMSQYSVYALDDYGVVSAIDGVTLTDSTKSWSATSLKPTAATRTAYVAITDGPGIGQVRNLVSNTATTFTIDSPFDVPPVPGQSAYTIAFFVNESLVVQDNVLGNGETGITPYDGGLDISIRRNKIYGSHGIRLKSNDIYGTCTAGDGKPSCVNGVHYNRALAWHTDIVGNTLDNAHVLGSSGTAVSGNGNYPEAIWANTAQFEVGGTANQGLHGNSIFDVEIRDNAITAHAPNVPIDTQNDNDGYYAIGAWGSNHANADPSRSPYPAPLVSVLGVILGHNTSTNAGNTPLTTTPGIYGMVNAQNFGAK